MNIPLGYPVVLLDDSAFAPVNLNSSNLNSSAATGTFIKAGNRALTPPSYTFVTTTDQYMKIFSAQCDRVSAFIHEKLEQLDRSDDDQNEEIVDSIANVIDLVGEPASCTAEMEARLLEDESFIFERLLLAIATAHYKETEAYRLRVLRQYAGNANYLVRRAAVRALGRMDTEGAKRALREISGQKDGGEISHFAAALLK
jgi:hypothetical protein